MIIIYFIAIYAILIALSVFFYINISLLSEKYHALKTACVMGSGFSFAERIKYFALVGKEVYRINFISALICGILGSNFHIGVPGVVVGLVIGWFVPKIILSRYRKKYFRKMDDQIYTSLTLIGNGIKASESLPQAIESTKSVLGYPISNEFDIVLRQIRIGMSVEDALENLSERVPLDDLRLTVMAMSISIKTGANLPDALKKIAETIRARNALYRKISALTIQGKAEGVVVGLLPFFLAGILYLVNPEFMSPLFNTIVGNCFLALIIILEVVAFFVIKKITTVNI